MVNHSDVLERAKRVTEKARALREKIKGERERARATREEDAEKKLAASLVEKEKARKFGDAVRSQYPDREFPVGAKDLPTTTEIGEFGKRGLSMETIRGHYGDTGTYVSEEVANKYLEDEADRRFNKKPDELSDTEYQLILEDGNRFRSYYCELKGENYIQTLKSELFILSRPVNQELADTYRYRKMDKGTKTELDIAIEKKIGHDSPLLSRERKDYEQADLAYTQINDYIGDFIGILDGKNELRELETIVCSKRKKVREQKLVDYYKAELEVLEKIRAKVLEVIEREVRKKVELLKQRPHSSVTFFEVNPKFIAGEIEKM